MRLWARVVVASSSFWDVTKHCFDATGRLTGNALLGILDAQPRAHHAHTTPCAMSSNEAHAATTVASGDFVTVTTPASLADAGEAFPRLPNHLVVTHVLRSEHFDDPADLARLPAVSRAMRDVVAAMGLHFVELDEWKAARLGCLSALLRRQRQGRLSYKQYLCYAAARSGQLEKLQLLRANGCLWGDMTCASAAEGGQLDVPQWARANGCPWDEWKCPYAATGGHLEVLQWLRANDAPWDEWTCSSAALGGHLEVLQWLCANGCP